MEDQEKKAEVSEKEDQNMTIKKIRDASIMPADDKFHFSVSVGDYGLVCKIVEVETGEETHVKPAEYLKEVDKFLDSFYLTAYQRDMTSGKSGADNGTV